MIHLIYDYIRYNCLLIISSVSNQLNIIINLIITTKYHINKYIYIHIYIYTNIYIHKYRYKYVYLFYNINIDRIILSVKVLITN